MLPHLRAYQFYLLVFIHLANCQVPFLNNCPEVNVVEYFDIDRYMGTWYEYSKYPFIFEVLQKCQQAVYKNEGNDTISVINTGVILLVNRPNSATGTAKVIAPGQLAVSFRNHEIDNPNYLVLGTDYDNWVVVYSCRNITSYTHTKLLWILTRQRQPSEEVISAAKQVIKNNKLPDIFLLRSSQANCHNISEPFDQADGVTEALSSLNTAEAEPDFDITATSTERVIDAA